MLHNAAQFLSLEDRVMPKLSDYLTVGDAANLLGVSKDTLRRWDRAGRLTARRHPVTGYRPYLREELADWFKKLKAELRPKRR